MYKNIVFLYVCFVLACTTNASLIYTTMPTGNFNPDYAFAVGGPTSPWGEIDVAASFIVPGGTNLYLDNIEVAIAAYSMPTVADVIIMTDSSERPAAILQSSQITAPANASLITAEFANNLLLTAGSKYWVCVSAQSSGRLLWKEPSTPLLVTGDFRCRFSNNHWQTSSGYSYMPAFRVNGIPEPATICIIGIGALSLLRRKKQ